MRIDSPYTDNLTATGAIAALTMTLRATGTATGTSTLFAASTSNVRTQEIPDSGVDGRFLLSRRVTQAQGDILYHDGTTWNHLPAGSSGRYLQTKGASANPAWEPVATSGTDRIVLTVGDGSVVIPTGPVTWIEVPFACSVTKVTMLADVTGSIVIDIWKDTYANYPPTDSDSITSATPPTITSNVKSQDSTLASWITTISAGDILKFNVDSCSNIKKLVMIISVTRS